MPRAVNSFVRRESINLFAATKQQKRKSTKTGQRYRGRFRNRIQYKTHVDRSRQWVTRLDGSAFVAGDSLKLFSKPLPNGGTPTQR